MRAVMVAAGSLVLVLLAGCASNSATDAGHALSHQAMPPAGKYQNSEQWLASAVGADVLGRLPNDKARADYQHCTWLFMTVDMTPAQLGNLNDFARGQGHMWRETEAALYQRISGPPPQPGDYSFLQPYCPDKIAEFNAPK